MVVFSISLMVLGLVTYNIVCYNYLRLIAIDPNIIKFKRSLEWVLDNVYPFWAILVLCSML